MAVVTDTIQVTGVRCERCVGRLAVALRGHEGIESANANLIGEVTLSWESELTSRDAIVATLSRAGFYEATSSSLGNTVPGAVVRP